VNVPPYFLDDFAQGTLVSDSSVVWVVDSHVFLDVFAVEERFVVIGDDFKVKDLGHGVTVVVGLDLVGFVICPHKDILILLFDSDSFAA
jgi:hypothetical protein